MNVERDVERSISRIAGAIGEPARARMLYGLMDGRARTSTELSLIAGVSPSTASAHLTRLRRERLVRVILQGRYRYYSLEGPDVAGVLESLRVAAGGARVPEFVPNTPARLRAARTCYDHIAGALAVALHDRVMALGWIAPARDATAASYVVTAAGESCLAALGIDVAALRSARRRLAYPCLDWSERRPHVGGALGAALLTLAVTHRWVVREPHDRRLAVTPLGEREFAARFGLRL